jgi:hypothetical protein
MTVDYTVKNSNMMNMTVTERIGLALNTIQPPSAHLISV